MLIGFAFLINISTNTYPQYYFYISIALYGVLLFELYSTIFYSRYISAQYSLNEIDSRDGLTHILHHIVIPSLLYWSLSGFIFFHNTISLTIFSLVTSAVLFALLFYNISAYFEHQFKLENRTHYIYDVLLIFIVFCGVDSIISYFTTKPVSVLFFLIIFLMIITTVTAVRLSSRNIVKELLSGLVPIAISSLIVILGLHNNVHSILLAFLIANIYYYFLAMLHHLRDGDLNSRVLTEYIVVFLLLLVLIFGIR